MSEIADWEKNGIKHFFVAQPTQELATTLAKIVSKNILTPQDLTGESADILPYRNRVNLMQFLFFRCHRRYTTPFKQCAQHSQSTCSYKRNTVQVFARQQSAGDKSVH